MFMSAQIIYYEDETELGVLIESLWGCCLLFCSTLETL